MAESHITVTLDELETAIRIWIRTSPAHIWRRDEAYERLRAEKRHDPLKAPDPQVDLAAYLTECVKRVGWTVSHEPRGNPFSGFGGR